MWGDPQRIVLNPELAELLPPLSQAQLTQQHEALVLEGRCREPLTVWPVPNSDRQMLLLGYEIFPFLRVNRIAFQVMEVELADLDHARSYILRDALARRLLSPVGVSYLRGYQYAADKQPRGGDRKSAHRVRGRGKTAEILAEVFGVTVATIERDAQITLAVHRLMSSCGADVKRLLLSGECRVRKGDVIDLAALPREQQQALMEHLRQHHHLPRNWRTNGEPVTLTVPVEPTAMAERIVRRRGPEQAQRVCEELRRILEELKMELTLKGQGRSSDGGACGQNGCGNAESGAVVSRMRTVEDQARRQLAEAT
jgi:hypothetical protein